MAYHDEATPRGGMRTYHDVRAPLTCSRRVRTECRKSKLAPLCAKEGSVVAPFDRLVARTSIGPARA